jgi:hypothetical protein
MEEECTKRKDLSHQIGSMNPVSHRIYRSYEGVKLSWAGGEKSRHKELSSGYRPSGDQDSQGRENRDINSHEILMR